MTGILSIALSGLTAQGVKLAKSAENIANASSTGGAVSPAALPPSGLSALPLPSTPSVYKPLTVNFTTLDTGGVRAEVSEDASGNGVDIAAEMMSMLEAKTAFKANLAMLKTQAELDKEVLDITA